MAHLHVRDKDRREGALLNVKLHLEWLISTSATRIGAKAH
jgi:hypothetical protein